MIYSKLLKRSRLPLRPFFWLQPRSVWRPIIPNLKDRRLLSYDTGGTFKDRIVLKVSGGSGGAGCLSFSRAPNQEYAPPDGGNGGDGGSVWLRVDPDCRSLRQSTTTIRAPPGNRGMPAKSRGRVGDDLFISIPPGTIVYELCSPTNTEQSLGQSDVGGMVAVDNEEVDVSDGEDDNNGDDDDDDDNDDDDDDDDANELESSSEDTDEDEDEQRNTQALKTGAVPLHKLSGKDWDTLIGNLELFLKQTNPNGAPNLLEGIEEDGKVMVAELNSVGESILAAAGGRGGRGNAAYKSSSNRTPMQADDGAPGETRRLELVLKTIADIGLVGFPNAGKSTLLRAVSHAKPKVAAYPFTTLRPHIGVMNTTTQREGEFDRTLTIADIPGLIEGAHDDRGLGHDFLRHIERTSFLVYVIDVAAVGSIDPCKALRVLRKELELHLPGLSSRAGCIVANKMDGGEQARKNLARLITEVGDTFAVFPVSAKYGVGVSAVVKHLSENVQQSLRDVSDELW